MENFELEQIKFFLEIRRALKFENSYRTNYTFSGYECGNIKFSYIIFF